MNDDLIKRADAINLCEKWRNRTNEHHDKNGWYIADTLLKTIKELPSADRPQGEWIDAEIPLESGGSMPIQVCNLCKTFYPLAYTGGGHRFCPNCGADMRKESE